MSKPQSTNYEIYYEVYGQGEPLILIPGFATGLWIWYHQIPIFSKSYKTIVFDNRGVGRSTRAIYPYSMQMMADDVANLMDLLKIKKANILGASMGGFIAQEFALKYPEKTINLILCCTSFGGKNHVPPSTKTLLAMSSFQDPNSEERVRKNLQFAFAQDFQESSEKEMEKIVNLRLANPIITSAYLSQLQAAITFDIERQLANLEIPTLIVTGDKDLMVPPENSYNLAKTIPNSKLAVVDGIGHSVFIESPIVFNQLVNDFLSSQKR
ncbi:MAG: alpha/beta hydrolase, partial [bacterium]